MATASVGTEQIAGATALGVRRGWRIQSAGTIAGIAIVTAVYVVASRFGLALDAVGGFAALVWPGSGIALAALLLGGFRLWPAIALGALITNLWAGAPIPAAIGIAAGNTGEALVGAYLLTRLPDFRSSLERVRDVLALIMLAGLLSTAVSATVGVASLTLAAVIPPSSFAETWRAWWLGDAIGVLLVATFILAWAAWSRRRYSAARAAEAVALTFTVAAAGLVVFGLPTTTTGNPRGPEYLLFPPLIWGAIRFGLRGAVTATLLVTAIAIAQTSAGQGPFVRGELHESLVALQTFMGVLGATIVLLGASISERRRAVRELRAAREVAEAANRAKANFLGVVSHELRTPLNAITGYVDLLALGLEGPLTQKQRAILDRIVYSQRHLLSLIEDVLSFAQTEAGRLSFMLQPVSVAEALESVETIVAQEIRRKDLTLHVAGCGRDVHVQADPDKLRQVLLNLVTNAMKFTPSGGSIELVAAPEDSVVRITVKDTGIGIPRENLSRVFDPFYQVDQGGTRRFPGVGLGLSIVRDSVLAMGGDVDIDSIHGKGTEVHVILPRAASHHASSTLDDTSAQETQ